MRDIEDLGLPALSTGAGHGCCAAPARRPRGPAGTSLPSAETGRIWRPLARELLSSSTRASAAKVFSSGDEIRGVATPGNISGYLCVSLYLCVSVSLSCLPLSFTPLSRTEQVHLELTDKCNAACPQCSRNDMGGLTNPLLPLTELRLRDVQAMLPPRVLRQLRRVMLCGNYGDPIMAKDCKEILNWMRRESPETRLSMHTNGGARAASWWRSLGSVMSGRNYVRFGIDGLEDTNHLYRQHVNWRTLMRNAQAFIAGGGNAQWDYLVFAHNEHQVEAARDLAVALGFSEFSPKKTQRFLNKATGVVRPTYGVKDRSGAVVRDLEPPRAAEWVNTEVEHTWRQLLSSYGSQEAVHAASVVHCKTGRDGDRSVYLAADGLVWPCCWLAQQMYLLRPIILLTADPFCIGILYCFECRSRL